MNGDVRLHPYAVTMFLGMTEKQSHVERAVVLADQTDVLAEKAKTTFAQAMDYRDKTDERRVQCAMEILAARDEDGMSVSAISRAMTTPEKKRSRKWVDHMVAWAEEGCANSAGPYAGEFPQQQAQVKVKVLKSLTDDDVIEQVSTRAGDEFFVADLVREASKINRQAVAWAVAESPDIVAAVQKLLTEQPERKKGPRSRRLLSDVAWMAKTAGRITDLAGQYHLDPDHEYGPLTLSLLLLQWQIAAYAVEEQIREIEEALRRARAVAGTRRANDEVEPDLYEILGVAPTADQKEIKKAYRALAKDLHPDVNPDPEGAERMKIITLAWEILGDEANRVYYDQRRKQPGTHVYPTGTRHRRAS